MPMYFFWRSDIQLDQNIFSTPRNSPEALSKPRLQPQIVLVRSPVDLIVPFSTHIYLAYEYVQVRKAVKSYT